MAISLGPFKYPVPGAIPGEYLITGFDATLDYATAPAAGMNLNVISRDSYDDIIPTLWENNAQLTSVYAIRFILTSLEWDTALNASTSIKDDIIAGLDGGTEFQNIIDNIQYSDISATGSTLNIEFNDDQNYSITSNGTLTLTAPNSALTTTPPAVVTGSITIENSPAPTNDYIGLSVYSTTGTRGIRITTPGSVSALLNDTVRDGRLILGDFAINGKVSYADEPTLHYCTWNTWKYSSSANLTFCDVTLVGTVWTDYNVSVGTSVYYLPQ